MTRQRFLVGLLAGLLLFLLPYTLMEQSLTARRKALDTAQATVASERKKAAELREREEKLAERAAAVNQVSPRFVSADASREIWFELNHAAKKSGVELGKLEIKAPEQLTDLQGWIQYPISVQVQGNRVQFVAFLQQLERSKYLIQIPDLNLTLNDPFKRQAVGLPTGANTVPSDSALVEPPTTSPAEIDMTLQLHFFGQAPK